MRKIGRPKSENLGSKNQRRMSVSFSEKAWQKLEKVSPGHRSRMISFWIEAGSLSDSDKRGRHQP